MTVPQKVSYFRKSVAHDRMAIRWLESRWAPRTLARTSELSWSRHALRWHISLYALYHSKLLPALPPHYQSWLCIHHFEGSWTDDGGPYYGGLQFGWNEWKRFGGRFASQANFATPIEQMWAAEGYWRVSGFYPWPNTARMCGLL